jgi:uncharacterized protein YndB with AHSA1/START domain
MVTRQGAAERFVPAPPDAVFAVITDVDRLPEWNDIIQRVEEKPPALVEGAEWVVRVRPPGMPGWNSRSTVLAIDPDARRFRYRSRTDDGNPSYGDWAWDVRPTDGGSTVRCSWELHPVTRTRRLLLSRVRNRALRREVPVSIDAIARLAAAGTEPGA